MGSCFSVRSRDNAIRVTSLTSSSSTSLRASLLDQDAKQVQMQDASSSSGAAAEQGDDAIVTYRSPMISEANGGAAAGNDGTSNSSTSSTSNNRAANVSSDGAAQRRNSTKGPGAFNVNPLVNATSLIRCEYAGKTKADWFIKRGQFIKTWKRRYFVLDGWELRYYEDAQKSVEKGRISLRGATCRYVDDSNSSGGANIVINSISFTDGATNGGSSSGSSGGRELLVECDSSYKAENWMDFLMDILVVENTRILRLAFPDAPQPALENVIYPNPYINQGSAATTTTTTTSLSSSDLAELLRWCRECVYWYEDAIDVLETSFVGVASGKDAKGETTSERCIIQVSPDRKSLLWRTLRPEEGDPPALDKRDRARPSAKENNNAPTANSKGLNAKASLAYLNTPAVDMALDSDPAEVKGQFCSIPFNSIRDLLLGSLRSGSSEEDSGAQNNPVFNRTKTNSYDSTGFGRESMTESYYPSSEVNVNNSDVVLSIVTPFHSLEIELDEEPISDSSMWIDFSSNGSANSNTPAIRRSSLGRSSTIGSDEKQSMSTTTATATSTSAAKVTPQQLATCPRIMRRHPFIRALRTVLLLQPYIPMLDYILRTTSITTTIIDKQNSKSGKGRQNDKNATKKAQLRPVQRVWEKTGQITYNN